MTIAETVKDLAITMRPIDELIPYARNARKHPEKQIAQLAGSIAAFGFNNPVLVDEQNRIIAGHGRVLAAEKLGLKEVPTIRLDHLSETDRRAFILADNRIAENSGWDSELLALEMADLSEFEFDVSLTGFTDAEINKLLSSSIEADPREDETPEVQDEPVSRIGDLWALGDHRVLCGDATSAADVGRLLGGNDPVLMATDPPYGVEYRPEWRNEARGQASRRIGKVLNDDRADWREAWALFPGDIAYVWHAALHAATVAESLEVSGFALRAQIVWAKERMVLSRGDYHWHHEPAWYAVRKTGKGRWLGDRKQTTLWRVASRRTGASKAQDADTIHSTQKPVELMRRPILNHSRAGETVYDPFLGSGTTLIAAENTGRRAFGLEIDPRYIDVIIRRWQDFSHGEAILDSDGRSFDAIAAARAATEPPKDDGGNDSDQAPQQTPGDDR